jgi:hypothetical protein
MSDQPPVMPPTGNDSDDIFSALPPKGPSSSSGTPIIPPYMPPALPPKQNKGPNKLLYILIGLILAVFCMCGTCVVGLAVVGGSIASNPTFQAVLSTGMSMIQAPDRLPANIKKHGSISANETENATATIGVMDTWIYSGKSGEHLTIAAQSNSKSFIPFLGIYDSQGKLLGRSETNSTERTETLAITLPSSGTYTILVGGFGSTFGTYTLTVSSSSNQ